MGVDSKVIPVFLAIVTIAVIAGLLLRVTSATVIPNNCNHKYPCTPQMSSYTPTFSTWLPTFSTTPIDSYNIGDTVTKSLTVSNSSAQADENYADGTVNYIYAKWLILKDEQTYQSGDWVKLSNPTYTHSFSLSPTSPGKYAFAVVLVSASSTFDETTGAWSDYTVSAIGTEKYVFTVNAPTPPAPSNALVEFFNNLVQSLLDLLGNLFG